jgi:deazaflavin-dependent oxidoreductase (nitroreductase family)
VLLLRATGRKTGRKRTTPLLYAPVDGGYVVIASKGGAPSDPQWYRNLVANPTAEVRIGRSTIPVRARTAEGAERDRYWRALTDLYAGYDRYQAKTNRRIPVVFLQPHSAGGDTPS